MPPRFCCAGCILLSIAWLPTVLTAGELELLADGQSAYQIVLSDEHASPQLAESLRQTARLVQTAFQTNGATVPVVLESQREASKPSLFIGQTRFARQQGIDSTKFRDWSYVQRVVGRDVILVGHDHPARGESDNPRRPNWDRVGTAKAVVDFVRQFMGVRFLYPELPGYTPLSALAKIELLKSPAIEFLPLRRMTVPDNWQLHKSPVLRLNTSHPAGGSFYDLAHNRFPRVDEVFGGHTWERAVPAEKYWPEHPEYFALINGQRLKPEGGRAQYCLSNPDVQELIYRDLASWFDRGYASVDLGQPDGFRECQCERCAQLYDTGANWSEKIWLFNRRVAERLQQSHPGREVTMMSYILTATPPRTFRQFPANTCIMLTGTNEVDFAPWRDIDVPRGFTGYIYNWCPNLATRYTPMRTPGYVEQQVKRLAANRIQSLFRDGPGQLFGLEGPVYYVMGRMFDDPDRNAARDLLTEFYEAAFENKSAAFYMRSFYEQLNHAIALYSDHIGTRCDVWTYQPLAGEGRPRKTVQDPFQLLAFLYTPSLLTALDADLTQAEQQVRGEKTQARLALIRREFEYVRHLARVVHLYQAYQIQPDDSALERLLAAIDARNAYIGTLYDSRDNGKPHAAWNQVLFPFPGHDAKHLRLAYDGYQEPFANTCLNWDTQAMRRAPSVGRKRLTIARATGPVTLDAPQWQQTTAHEFMLVPPLRRLPRTTTLRLLYDAEQLYILGESELEPDHPTSYPAWPRDRDPASQESIEFYVQPQAGREVFYRLAVGVHADSKYDARNGFITDPIDPRFGKDDPTWNGIWHSESRLDAQQHRWLTLLTIPFSTLGVEPPAAKITWRGNFARHHWLPRNPIERSIWSSSAVSSRLDDRGIFGELVFE